MQYSLARRNVTVWEDKRRLGQSLPINLVLLQAIEPISNKIENERLFRTFKYREFLIKLLKQVKDFAARLAHKLSFS